MGNSTDNQETLSYEIVVDHSETANKCTVLPLSYRKDFAIHRFHDNDPSLTLQSHILLHHNGEPLDELDLSGVRQIAVIDSIWRRLPLIQNSIAAPLPILAKIPFGFKTAYPRRSKIENDLNDPSGGLATIEAIFIAAALVGRWDLSLLREYYFADQFIADNIDAFKQYGVAPKLAKGIYKPKFPKYSRHLL
jgi:pre-rRNA-processing protein TSR3